MRLSVVPHPLAAYHVPLYLISALLLLPFSTTVILVSTYIYLHPKNENNIRPLSFFIEFCNTSLFKTARHLEYFVRVTSELRSKPWQ